MGRPAGWTSDKRENFLNTLRACLNVRRAAAAVGLTDSAAYQLRRRDAEFAQKWAEALDEGYQNLELELIRQSTEGSERTELVQDGLDGPVKQIKIIHSFPHLLALKLMHAHREDVLAFRLAERAHQREDGAMERVRAHMALVHERLRGAGATVVENSVAEDGAEDAVDGATSGESR
jgi:hypothetical protein